MVMDLARILVATLRPGHVCSNPVARESHNPYRPLRPTSPGLCFWQRPGTRARLGNRITYNWSTLVLGAGDRLTGKSADNDAAARRWRPPGGRTGASSSPAPQPDTEHHDTPLIAVDPGDARRIGYGVTWREPLNRGTWVPLVREPESAIRRRSARCRGRRSRVPASIQHPPMHICCGRAALATEKHIASWGPEGPQPGSAVVGRKL
jgi:hypothetical protein